MSLEFNFNFGSFTSRVIIREKLPQGDEIPGFERTCLVICDEHTEFLAQKILKIGKIEDNQVLRLVSGEENKGWAQVETILKAARRRGLGRDGLFLAIGGGALCDLAAFAASIYMRGAALVLVPTTLLAMADAALGGKTGFDLDGVKNLAGTFYPASVVFAAMETLESLPEREWKSGMAEIIKAAILDGPGSLEKFRVKRRFFHGAAAAESGKTLEGTGLDLENALGMAIRLKGRIVEADPKESGLERVLLNLGHTFGHALESACGLGVLSHGEAVAWGIARSCELGLTLGITPPERAKTIQDVLSVWGYEIAARPSVPLDPGRFKEALFSDKKKKSGGLRFVVPNADGAECTGAGPETERYIEQLMERIA